MVSENDGRYLSLRKVQPMNTCYKKFLWLIQLLVVDLVLIKGGNSYTNKINNLSP